MYKQTNKKDMTATIQTTERTFNNNIKKQLLELMPTANKIKKLHVAGVGYVYFIKDENNNILGKIFKEVENGMMIYVN